RLTISAPVVGDNGGCAPGSALPVHLSSEDEAVMGKYIAIGSLLVLLAFVLWVVYQQWILVVVDIPAGGWAAIILGGGLSLAVGFGLMALMYYSEREGYDEPPH